ncbi:hypothetical protein KI387_024734 [Taxus chinensis]|uniref:Pentatricopeptide repeat-containing protein n=1 Tax=Taxus chinensis TaxID=29808 RepID=A0AA38G4X5_TAXCH|nr:hypothetical protein KI387_024734 [Taxus chinensis]
MRSRLISNGLKWLASERTRSLLNPSSGFASRFRTGDLQSVVLSERQRRLYDDSGLIFPSFIFKTFSSEALAGKKVQSPSPKSGANKLKRELFRQKHSEGKMITALEMWAGEGKKLNKAELLFIVRKLRKFGKFQRALQISEWMQKCKDFEFVSGDHAIHMDLIAKVHSVARVEKYFADLPENARGVETHNSLLHCYVRKQLIEKAEQQFKKIKELGLATNEHAYNEMMTLYMSIGQADKVLLEIKHMKEMNVLPDWQTYNLWMSACSSLSDDIDEVEKIMDELKAGGENNIHWTTYSTLANIYIDAGVVSKAEAAVKEAEKRIPQRYNDAYNSLITLYGALGDKEGVHRIWQSLKKIFRRPLFSNYISVLSSLVKVGDIEGAEKTFQEWESFNPAINCKLSNILLDAYIKKGMLEKAEIFQGHVLEKNCVLNGRSWEILTEGYLECKQMSKAILSMKEALTKGKSEEWQPKSENVTGLVKHFEEQGNVEDAEEFLKLVRRFKCLTTEIYNLLLLTYVKAGKAAPKVLEEMAKDNVSPDEETDRLLKIVNEEGLND